MNMDIKWKRILALVMIAVMITASAMLAACKKSGNGSGDNGSDGGNGSSGSSQTQDIDYNPENAFLAGKCYVLAGMSSEDEDFDEDLIKEMFDIDDITEYMSLYFDKTGKAYMSSLLYKNVEKGDWSVEEGYVLMVIDEDMYEIRETDNGMITTDKVEEDGEVFTLTFREVDEAPEALKEYIK